MTLFSNAKGEPSRLDTHVQEILEELHSQWLCKFGLQSLTKELNLDRSNVPRKLWHSTIELHFQYRHPSWISSRDGHIRETCVGYIIPGLFEIKPEEKVMMIKLTNSYAIRTNFLLTTKLGPTSQIWQRPSSSLPTRNQNSKLCTP